MSKPWLEDAEFKEHEIEEARREGDGYAIQFNGGWFINTPDNPDPRPQKGDKIRIYGHGIGYTVRGVAVWRDDEWQPIWYRSHEQQAVKDAIWIAERRLEGLKRLEAQLLDRRHRIDALPEPFQDRLRHFQEIGDMDYRADNEEYELFVCEEAVEIANAFQAPEEVAEFHKASLEEQRKVLPGLSYSDHSGNTFGAACRLAHLYLSKAYNLIANTDYGALAPLIGSYRKDD